MSPAPNRRHQGIVMLVSGELYQFLQDKPCEVYVAPFDVRLADEPGAPEDTFASRVLDGFTLEVGGLFG